MNLGTFNLERALASSKKPVLLTIKSEIVVVLKNFNKVVAAEIYPALIL